MDASNRYVPDVVVSKISSTARPGPGSAMFTGAQFQSLFQYSAAAKAREDRPNRIVPVMRIPRSIGLLSIV